MRGRSAVVRLLGDLRDEARLVRATLMLTRALSRRSKRGGIALVVHVWYPQEWALIMEAIRTSSIQDVDVVVTLPDGAPVSDEDLSGGDWPLVVVRVPNRGRDVLAFVRVMPAIRRAGYDVVLKVHTKRSVHSDMGGAWLQESLASLLGPGVDAALDALRTQPVSMIGPRSYYFPLTAALSENPAVLKWARKVLGRRTADQVLAAPGNYGFFAGTMFWARTTDIAVKVRPRAWQFQREAGQVNGTTAHALERVLCLPSQLTGQSWSMSVDGGLSAQTSMATVVPRWVGDEQRKG